MNFNTFSLSLTAALAVASPALADGDHAFGPDPSHPDVEIAAHDEGGEVHLEVLTGMWFSVSPDSSFADRGGFIATASPGFPGFAAGEDDHDHDHGGEEADHGDEHDHDHLPLTGNTAVNFNPTGNLRVFDSLTGTFVAAANETVSIYKGFSISEQYVTEVSALGVAAGTGDSDGQTFVKVGTTNAEGSLHSHVDWTLEGLAGAPSVGAYLLEGTISAAGYEDSEVFPLLFNYGLSDAQFDEAIDVAAAVYNVPEPTSAALLAGLGGLAMMRRRQKI